MPNSIKIGWIEYLLNIYSLQGSIADSQSAEEGYQKDLVPTRIWTADPWVMRPVW